MAIINSVDLRDQDVIAHISLSRKEYAQLGRDPKELLILPADNDSLKLELTTGKLGNGNRIMFPNRIMKLNEINLLPKKVPASVFSLEEDKFLLIKLRDSRPGVPIFPEDWKWKI